MNKLHIYKTGNVLGILSVVFFGLCMFWGVLITDPALKTLHLNLLKIAYPGFTLDIIGVLIGIAWAYAYGWLFGALFAWLCRKVCITK